MSDIAIKIENLSKQYRLGTVGSGTVRGDLQRAWHRLRGKEDPTLKIGETNRLDTVDGDLVWALQDINLEVKQGEILGIIGKNGAGKSTLLKILSRVTGPTTGSIKVNGRLASLLEVGTGFHGELTGRENIFLNGAILGMTKNDIKRKLDEIIEFAGVAKYVDTPVKRYSSGMYVRLGFAVAAFLEPEILIVDEVLAVGDAEFQKKAIGKMQDISQDGGRTVLFVSHNMDSIQKLCTKALLLKNGLIETKGEVKAVIENYLSRNSNLNEIINIKEHKRISGYGDILRITDIEIVNSMNKRTTNILFTEKFKIKITVKALKGIKNIDVSIRIDTETNIPLTSIVSNDSNVVTDFKENEIKEFILDLENFLLTPGMYSLVVTVKSGRMAYDRLENIVTFEVSNLVFGNNKPHNELWGYVQIYPKWEVQTV